MSWMELYRQRRTDAAAAVAAIASGQRVYLGAGCAVPHSLVAALVARAGELRDVEILHILTAGEASYAQPGMQESFRCTAMFVGPNVREAVNCGRAGYIPVHLHEVPDLLRGSHRPDVALVQVSPPDEHGFCSFGVSVDIIKPAAERSRLVVAEVNTQMPRTLGDCFIHVSKLSYVVEVDRPLLELPREPFTDVHTRIGTHIAELIEDGSTLQLGIGAIPDAVLSQLGTKRDLGIHTEMFADGVMELFEAGVINNEKKSLHRGKIVSSFVMGSRPLYNFIDNNPVVEMHPSHYVNDPFIIAKNDKMVSINSAISIDLTGQVNSDSMGTTFFSGIGGQVDFVRGAQRAKNGKAVIAFPSTAKGGEMSRIVGTLADGAGVVTSRGDVNYIVTEYGVAQLHGKSIRERAKALINIAHPKFRGDLEKFAKEHHYI